MSYLPRMSKTYKEPAQPPEQEEPEANQSSLNIQPASSLMNERTHNPQATLTHYKYLPHALPSLPGPSLATEASENELHREMSRVRRSESRIPGPDKSHQITFAPAESKSSLDIADNDTSLESLQAVSKVNVDKKASKVNVTKKKPSKSSVEKKKGNSSKVNVHMCLTGSDITKSFVGAQTERQYQDFNKTKTSRTSNGYELHPLKDEISFTTSNSDTSGKFQSSTSSSHKQILSETKKLAVRAKEVVHRTAQCTIFGSAEKVFVIPRVMYSLLRALAFLLHELNREDAISCSSGEKKRLLTQIQLVLGDLCTQNVEKEFGFDTTYSDSKRLEKIYGELQKYIKDMYGDKAEFVDSQGAMKKMFVEWKKKEMELAILKDKILEKENAQTVEVNESEFRNPEIILQNKRLESEQLLAEIEFSGMELKKYQTVLAEVDWDIKNSQEQVASLKKSLSSKSKTEMPSKKISAHKVTTDAFPKGSKSKENEDFKKQTK